MSLESVSNYAMIYTVFIDNEEVKMKKIPKGLKVLAFAIFATAAFVYVGLVMLGNLFAQIPANSASQ